MSKPAAVLATYRTSELHRCIIYYAFESGYDKLSPPRVLVHCVAIALTAAPTDAWSDDSSTPFSAGGLIFGDLYHIPNHHLPEGNGATAAVLRRGYLTADTNFENGWFGRLRVEVNQSGDFETYEFQAGIKDAYVGYKFERHTVMLGLQPSLTFDFIESFWTMRYLMRTPADLQGVPSRDTGISLKGQINEAWRYRAMIGVGADFGAESGDGDNAMVAINWKLSDNWTIDFYADHEARPGPEDNTSGQLFAAYQGEGVRVGLQYFYRDRENNAPGKLASAFFIKNVGQDFRFVGRLDRLLDPSIRGDDNPYIPFAPTAKATMYLVGLEYQVADKVVITPNSIVISYDRDDQGLRPNTDVYLRLTVFANFE